MIAPLGQTVLLEGWRAIATHVTARTGLRVTRDAAWRWSARDNDPLPVRRFGGGRPRVVADADELDAWCRRQWRRPGAV